MTGQAPPEVEALVGDAERRAGKYVRVELLGRGGMGEVWKAWDLDLGRWVALKFLLHSLDEDLARFRREARTLAALTHPHIAALYDTGVAGGKPFIVMQYVPGRPLGPDLPLRDAVRHVRDAALAVQHAHDRGVIHRDLKPPNLLVLDHPPEPPKVFVLDFGLARPTAEHSRLSQTGLVQGTPAYMAPEQARGQSEGLDGRTDVYALGATLYELAAGRAPFAGPDPLVVLRRVIDEDPPTLRAVSPGFDRDLQTIVMTCLEKEPSRRYATARALADDLGRWLAGEAIQARPPGPVARLVRTLVRHRRRVAAAAAGGALALAFMLPGWIRERRAREDHQLALETQRAAAEARERDLAELAALWSRVLLARQLAYQPHRTWEEVHRELGSAVAAVSDFVDRRPGRPEGLYLRAAGRLFLDDPEGAETDLREAVGQAPDFRPAWSLLGRTLMELHRRAGYASRARSSQAGERRTELRQEAVAAMARGRAAPADPSSPPHWTPPVTEEDVVNDTLVDAFHLHTAQEQPNAARERLRKAHERRRAGEYCAWLAFWSADPLEQIRLLDEALQLRPHYLDARVHRGYAFLRVGKARQAVEDFDAALGIRTDFPPALIGRSRARYVLGELEGAEADLDRLAALDPGISEVWTNRSALKVARRDWAGAVEDADRALALNPRSPLALSNRAVARAELEDFEGAESDFALALELQPGNPLSLVNRALVRIARQDLDGAGRDVDAALRLAGPFPDALLARAKIRIAQQRPADAREDLEQALRAAAHPWPARGEAAALLEALRRASRSGS